MLLSGRVHTADSVTWKQDAITRMIWHQPIYMSFRIVEVAQMTVAGKLRIRQADLCI